MVLQSVTRAVTRPMGRRLRRGWPPRFGKRITLVSRVSLFTSSHFTPSRGLDTGELDGCHFSRDRWGPGVKPIAHLPSTIVEFSPPYGRLRFRTFLGQGDFYPSLFTERSFLFEEGVSVQRGEVRLPKTR